MAANRDILDAFNECIDRLSLGQNIEVLVGQYPPRIAAQLRPMLEASQVARRATVYPTDEINAARDRARNKVLAALEAAPLMANPSADRKVIPFPVRRLLTAAAAVTVVIVMIAAFYPRGETPAVSETLTPPTEPAHTTAIFTETPTPTVTLTSTATETASPTQTITPSPSSSPTFTATATASHTASLTPSLTLTLTPSQSATPTPMATLTRTTPAPFGCIAVQPDGWVEYEVRSGDTLSALAINTGTTLDELQRINCITDPRSLRVEQEIFLPRPPTGGGSTDDDDIGPTEDPDEDSGGGGGDDDDIDPTDPPDDDSDDDDDDDPTDEPDDSDDD